MSGRRQPPQEPAPLEYTIEIIHRIFIVTQDGLVKRPGKFVDRRSYSPLDADFESVEAAADAILKDDDQPSHDFLVLPVVRKRVKL